MAGLKKIMTNFEMDDTKRYNNFVRKDHDMFKEMVDRLILGSISKTPTLGEPWSLDLN